jgi:3-oxoacyl-[acyl-carrier-protein] synthase III
MFSKISKIEYHLPSKISTRDELSTDNPDWRMDDIEEKTGVIKRHICEDDQTSIDLAVSACNKLFDSGVNKKDIELLIVVTESPEYILPPSSCILQDKIGLSTSVASFDINLGCSGFVYGLMTADAIMMSQNLSKALLVCVDTYSKYISKGDRTCRPLFSDAASATLLESSKESLIGPFELGTNGSGANNLIVKNSGTVKSNPLDSRSLFMNGSQVFMFTIQAVPLVVNKLLKKSNYNMNDIDLFIFHQASKLVIDNIVRNLDIEESKVFRNYQNIGNTVSSSIAIALSQVFKDKILRKGDVVMLVGFGVGYSWGGGILKIP